MTKKDILNRLKEGNRRFISAKPEGKPFDASRREDLTTGQNPRVIIPTAIDKGGLSIVPACHHLDTGKVDFL
jgi:carbonic anhydrase